MELLISIKAKILLENAHYIFPLFTPYTVILCIHLKWLVLLDGNYQHLSVLKISSVAIREKN